MSAVYQGKYCRIERGRVRGAGETHHGVHDAALAGVLSSSWCHALMWRGIPASDGRQARADHHTLLDCVHVLSQLRIKTMH